jgi:hypothetical protein
VTSQETCSLQPACLAHGAGRDNASSRPGTAEAKKGLLLAGAVAGGQPAVGGQPSKAAKRRSLTFFIPDPHARGELQSISGEAAAPPDESAKAVTVPHLAPELLLSSSQESEFGGLHCAPSRAQNALRGVGSRAGMLAGLETVDWELSGSLEDVSTHQLVAASSACMMTSAGRVVSQPLRASVILNSQSDAQIKLELQRHGNPVKALLPRRHMVARGQWHAG